VIRDSEAGRRGARWHRITSLLAMKGLRRADFYHLRIVSRKTYFLGSIVPA